MEENFMHSQNKEGLLSKTYKSKVIKEKIIQYDSTKNKI